MLYVPFFRLCIVGAIDGGHLPLLDGVCEGVQEEGGGTHLQVHTRQIGQGHLLVNTAAVDNIRNPAYSGSCSLSAPTPATRPGARRTSGCPPPAGVAARQAGVRREGPREGRSAPGLSWPR